MGMAFRDFCKRRDGSARMHNSQRNEKENIYRLAADLAVEHCHEESIILLASRDKLMKINKATATLLELIMNAFANRDFSNDDLTRLIERSYSLSPSEATNHADSIMSEWARQGILTPGEGQKTTGGKQ